MRPTTLLFTLLALLLPALAEACPSCAGRNDGGTAAIVLTGAMILFPFAVAATLVPVIRRCARPAHAADTLADGDPA